MVTVDRLKKFFPSENADCRPDKSVDLSMPGNEFATDFEPKDVNELVVEDFSLELLQNPQVQQNVPQNQQTQWRRQSRKYRLFQMIRHHNA